MTNLSAPVRVRIPPSPTGDLHVGNARTALYNVLFAQQHDGQVVLRMEDTDRERSKPEFESAIIEGLMWLGLMWDEGPDIGGQLGPYRQSERSDIYRKYITQLLSSDKAYHCFCPPAQKQGGQVHSCDCPHLSKDEVAQRLEQERTAIRLKVEAREVVFEDLVRGEIRVHTDSFGGDFVVARSADDAVYHLAVVVDDITMAITHVLRGEDHLHNTIKHILIQEALGASRPIYAHLPLLLDDQKRKLSKRRNETSLLAFREAGYLPETMLNYLALLGWNNGGDREVFTFKELVEAFSIERVHKSGAVFSRQKLDSLNKTYLRALPLRELATRAEPWLSAVFPEMPDQALLEKAFDLERERAATLVELVQAVSYIKPSWEAAYGPELLVWKKGTTEDAMDRLTKVREFLMGMEDSHFSQENLEKTMLAWIDEKTLGRGDTLWPLRVALAGREHSPGPFDLAALLHKDEVLRRIDLALDLL